MLKIPHIKNFLLLLYKPDELANRLVTIKIKRLSKLYPHSQIHLLTNTDISYESVICHKKDIPSNHLAKFHLYDLLDEPTMYLDLDVMLHRPFSTEHLVCDGNFNIYSKDPLPTSNHYNAGVIWIKRPTPNMREELQSIHEENFSHKKNDEFALSMYISRHNHKMKLSPDVNVLWWLPESKDCQSIHYASGPEPKKALIDDLHLYSS